MAGEFSFDIVSDFDRQELVNAVDQTHREMKQRYDLKSAKATLELEKEAIVIIAPAAITLRAIVDVLESKMVRRGLDLKILSFGPEAMCASGLPSNEAYRRISGRSSASWCGIPCQRPARRSRETRCG